MQTSSRKLLVVLIGLFVLGFVVYHASGTIHLGDFSEAKLLHAVRDANPLLLTLSILAIYACYALRSLRWKVFQRNLGPSHFGPIYAMTLAGFAAVFLLGRAGEPVRPLLLSRKEKLPLADLFGIYALERLFDLASAAVIAAIGLLLFQSRQDCRNFSRLRARGAGHSGLERSRALCVLFRGSLVSRSARLPLGLA